MRKFFVGLMLFSMAALSACGGGGNDGTTAPATATGTFIDAPVQGLTYESGSQKGVTDAEGRFTYEVGKTVRFTIGDIVIGEATGQPILTPVELAPAGSDTTTPEVLARVQLLMSLSSTDPADGKITITPAVRAAAQGKSIDFTSESVQTDLDSLVKALVPSATLATPTNAKTHLSSNYDKLFTVAKVSGKTFYSAGLDGYIKMTFNSDGTMTASSSRVWQGIPQENPYGTWQITTDGNLQIITTTNVIKTLKIATVDTTLSSMTFENNENVEWESTDRCFYDQNNGLKQAVSYMFFGKTLFNAGDDGYQSITFKADGTVTASSRITSGFPIESYYGTWDVTSDGKFQVTTTANVIKTLTIAFVDEGPAYMTFENGGGVEWEITDQAFYNQDSGLAQAIAYYNSLLPPLNP